MTANEYQMYNSVALCNLYIMENYMKLYVHATRNNECQILILI